MRCGKEEKKMSEKEELEEIANDLESAIQEWREGVWHDNDLKEAIKSASARL